jgi:integrase/recombinase XerD
MTGIREAAAEYLAVRRAIGFKLRGHDRLLSEFLDHLEASGATTVTTAAAVAWATAPAKVSAVRWSQRLSAVRGFARHLQCLDPATEVPPDDVLGCRRHRQTAFLYSDNDIARLLNAAAALRPALRGATHQAFFGLLAVTGMRIGEAIGLDRDDIDLDRGLIQIDDAKFRKHRRLPLHPTTVAALRRYAKVRDELCPTPKVPSFFVSTRGTRLIDVGVHGVFNKLVADLGFEPQTGAGRPQVHGLRH